MQSEEEREKKNEEKWREPLRNMGIIKHANVGKMGLLEGEKRNKQKKIFKDLMAESAQIYWNKLKFNKIQVG